MELPVEQLEQFDLIISDILLPRINVCQLVKKIQAMITNRPPILFISGYLEDIDPVDNGPAWTQYLSKSFSREELLDKVQELLEP